MLGRTRKPLRHKESSASQLMLVLDKASAQDGPVVCLLMGKPRVEGHWDHREEAHQGIWSQEGIAGSIVNPVPGCSAFCRYEHPHSVGNRCPHVGVRRHAWNCVHFLFVICLWKAQTCVCNSTEGPPCPSLMGPWSNSRWDANGVGRH